MAMKVARKFRVFVSIRRKEGVEREKERDVKISLKFSDILMTTATIIETVL